MTILTSLTIKQRHNALPAPNGTMVAIGFIYMKTVDAIPVSAPQNLPIFHLFVVYTSPIIRQVQHIFAAIASAAITPLSCHNYSVKRCCRIMRHSPILMTVTANETKWTNSDSGASPRRSRTPTGWQRKVTGQRVFAMRQN